MDRWIMDGIGGGELGGEGDQPRPFIDNTIAVEQCN